MINWLSCYQFCCVFFTAGLGCYLGGFEFHQPIQFEDAFVAAREKPRWTDREYQHQSQSQDSAYSSQTGAAAASSSQGDGEEGSQRAAVRQFEPYTMFVTHFHGEIDHVFYGSTHLRCDRWIPMPPHSAVIEHVALPNVNFPSDHLALVCELSFKWSVVASFVKLHYTRRWISRWESKTTEHFEPLLTFDQLLEYFSREFVHTLMYSMR